MNRTRQDKTKKYEIPNPSKKKEEICCDDYYYYYYYSKAFPFRVACICTRAAYHNYLSYHILSCISWALSFTLKTPACRIEYTIITSTIIIIKQKYQRTSHCHY
mmetsp:Transcript_26125/g.53788  ORF Transcript_26125/g.53788 Transcript_26125/m.53788 type:complete len:104 (+) Transcript_26125:1735-2046(+)